MYKFLECRLNFGRFGNSVLFDDFSAVFLVKVDSAVFGAGCGILQFVPVGGQDPLKRMADNHEPNFGRFEELVGRWVVERRVMLPGDIADLPFGDFDGPSGIYALHFEQPVEDGSGCGLVNRAIDEGLLQLVVEDAVLRRWWVRH